MRLRLLFFLVVAASVVATLYAKDKNKSTIPAYVLRASTVVVMVDPNAGEPVDEPYANSTARDNVERALTDWGRLRPMMSLPADLVIVVKTGSERVARPTIHGGPIDQRPGTAQGGDASVRVGAQQGQPPPMNDPTLGRQNTSPHIDNEIGTDEDSFLVYRGDVEHPLDAPAVWRYLAKDGLKAPRMAAVEEFRKALAEADKKQQSKKP